MYGIGAHPIALFTPSFHSFFLPLLLYIVLVAMAVNQLPWLEVELGILPEKTQWNDETAAVRTCLLKAMNLFFHQPLF